MSCCPPLSNTTCSSLWWASYRLLVRWFTLVLRTTQGLVRPQLYLQPIRSALKLVFTEVSWFPVCFPFFFVRAQSLPYASWPGLALGSPPASASLGVTKQRVFGPSEQPHSTASTVERHLSPCNFVFFLFSG